MGEGTGVKERVYERERFCNLQRSGKNLFLAPAPRSESNNLGKVL